MREWWNTESFAIIIKGACTLKVKHSIIILIFLIFIILSFGSVAYCKNNNREKLRDKILSLAMDNSPKLYDTLDQIDRLPIYEAMNLHMELTNYYIGEHGSEVLSEKITKIGDKIIPFLVEERYISLMCSDRYKSMCRKLEERNREIERMIDAIKKGIILYAEFPENLKTEHERDLKIIKLFLEDYKRKEGNYPKDLHILREYVWKGYGYKLRIFSPWFGQPLKYLPQNEDKYILEAGQDTP